ncbi:hypothetical protein SDC9_183847 [bioreactor metagenome]|uniref:Uncharacterized protein n=1 Tax=bioreactor metagenome TaxID=1076179 RepID=A0A645HBC9_9ZZZZ
MSFQGFKIIFSSRSNFPSEGILRGSTHPFTKIVVQKYIGQDIDAFDQITMGECDGTSVMEAKHTFLAYLLVEVNQAFGVHIRKDSFFPQPVIGVDSGTRIPSLCKQLVGTFNKFLNFHNFCY